MKKATLNFWLILVIYKKEKKNHIPSTLSSSTFSTTSSTLASSTTAGATKNRKTCDLLFGKFVFQGNLNKNKQKQVLPLH